MRLDPTKKFRFTKKEKWTFAYCIFIVVVMVLAAVVVPIVVEAS